MTDTTTKAKKWTKLEIDRQTLLLNQLTILTNILEANKPIAGMQESYEPIFEGIDAGVIKEKILKIVRTIE